MSNKYTPKPGEIEASAAQVKLCELLMTYAFKPEPYTYKGWAEPSWESVMNLAKGGTYILVDTGCESHFITIKAEFTGEHLPYERSKYLLFRALEKGDAHKKGDYFLVKPRIHVDSSCGRLKLNLDADHHLGQNKNKKVVVREAKVI